MLDPKKAAMPAAGGFALSFVIAIFSTRNPGHAVLRGLLFGAVFAILFAAIDFVYSKFLDEGASVPPPADEGRKPLEKSGSRIDITISDEELTDDSQNLKFLVGQNKQSLAAGVAQQRRPASPVPPAPPVQPVPAGQPAAAAPDPVPVSAPQPALVPAAPAEQGAREGGQPAFTPIALGRPAEGGAPSAPEKAASQPQPAKGGKKAPERDMEIEELPEIADFVPDVDDGDEDGGGMGGADFAGAEPASSVASARQTMIDGSKAVNHDAATLAKAIQTVLKQDE